MAWTAQQQTLLDQPFSYYSPTHKALAKEKLAQFQQLKNKQQLRNKTIGAGLLLGYGVSIFGPSILVMHSSSAVYLTLGAYFWASQASHITYTTSFQDMLEIYDWCIPNDSNVPPVDNFLIQQLIETMGSLVDNARIQRLSSLINGNNDSSSISHYAFSGAKSFFGSATSWLQGHENEKEQQVMQPEVFSLLVRQLVQGKSSSMLDYYLYGKGRQSIDGYIDKGLTFVPEKVKESFREQDDPGYYKSM